MRDPDAPVLPRLTRVEAINVRLAFRRPLLDATGEYTHRRSWLLRLVDEAGREGLGEATLDPFADDEKLGALARLVREWMPLVIAGRLPTTAEIRAEGPAGRALMAGLEGAFGGLAAAEGSGAGPASIPVCAAIGFGGPDAGADAAVQAIELGFGTLEIKAGHERTTDQLVERLRALRAAVGPEPRIRVDAGGAWSLDVATERLAGIERFRIEFVEQPLDAADLTGHAALRERVAVPVALDESIDSEGAAQAALMENAASVLVVKPARVGGAAAVRRIAEATSQVGVGVVLATYFETGVGMAAALRVAGELRAAGGAWPVAAGGPGGPAHSLATAGILSHDLLATPLPIENGHMAVPGLIALDEDEVARRAVERFEVGR